MKFKKWFTVFLISLSIFCLTPAFMPPIVSEAWTETEINKLTLLFSSYLTPGQAGGQVIVDHSDGRYDIKEVEIMNHVQTWQPDDIPQLKLYLYAWDGYYFKDDSMGMFSLIGEGAVFVSAELDESRTKMVLTVNLDSLSGFSELEIPGAYWDRYLGVACWDMALGADSYQLRLFQGNRPVGTDITVYNTEYCLGNTIKKSGEYSFQVRAIKASVPGPWVSSNVLYFSSEELSQIQARIAQGRYGWQKDRYGWWYLNTNGSYTTDNWQNIGGKWYYFNADGYMATGWVSWNGQWYYCDETGAWVEE